ncbi:hypothetical protein LSH36_7g18003 [Paralvinella palmiformis]|uniref:Cadherin domain-containing protein n=1 Tax=Paralvinella palmiformis TaxID=53620 RepID=A0AAD9KEL8_9ANNE|nr:hypothetical protein LSH36_7g18003 [Paralvinella palmiformis]
MDIFAMLSLSMSVIIWIPLVVGQVVPDDLSALFEVEEESPPRSYIGNVIRGAGLANIFNSSVLDTMEFGFIPEPDTNYIQLNAGSGDLRTLSRINREAICPGEVACFINIGIGIIKPSELFQVISVQVKVIDVNDQSPIFTPSLFALRFSEADPVGTIRTLPVATDLDSPGNGINEYRMVTPSTVFELLQVNNPINGMIDLKLRLVSELDRESKDFYTIRVEVLDRGVPPLTGNLVVEVTVEDDNDHAPRFGNDLYEVDVAEDLSVHVVFFTIKASDADQGENSRLVYGFSPRTAAMHGHLFVIDGTTGELSLTTSLDYESKQVYHLEVTATDQGSNPRTGLTTVKVRVLDVNDNKPQITISTLSQKPEAEIQENAPSGKIAAHVSVTDSDSGKNGQMMCNMEHPVFELRSLRVNQYMIVTTRSLDREDTARYVVSVECTDLGRIPLAVKQNLTVVVLDQNDNRPVFGQSLYSGAVPENLPENSYITMVNATDRDSGENGRLTYEIVDEKNVAGYVRINPDSGVILAPGRLDYELVQLLKFSVLVTDHGSPPLSAETTVSIRIIDQNDEAPVFQRKQYVFHIEENKPSRSLVGKVRATDKDSSPFNIMEYSLFRRDSLDQSFFAIDKTSGYIYTSRVLDHEETSVYYLNVLATDVDDTSLVGSSTITIFVQDVNDNQPVVHFPMEPNSTFPISNRIQIGYNITKIFATDPDEGMNGNVTFSIVSGDPDGHFRIDHRHGYIQTNVLFSDVKYSEYKLGIRIKDGGTPSQSTAVHVTITVDETIPFFPDDEALGGGIVQRTNLTIIIVVAAVSGFVIVILIIAIVVLKTTDCRCPDIIYKRRPNDSNTKGFSDINIKAVEANGYLQKCDPVKLPGSVPPSLLSAEDLKEHKLLFIDVLSFGALSPRFAILRKERHWLLWLLNCEQADHTPNKHRNGQRSSSSVQNSRNILPPTSQNQHRYSATGGYGENYVQPGYQHSPRYAPSEASYSGSHVSNAANNVKMNDLDRGSCHCTPDKSNRDPALPPYVVDISNGAHGHNRYGDHHPGYNRTQSHYVNPPPYHKRCSNADQTSCHGNEDSRNRASWESRSRDDLGKPVVSVRPAPTRQLKAVNV